MGNTSKRTVVVGDIEGVPDTRCFGTRRELSRNPTPFDFTFPFSFEEHEAETEQVGSVGTGLLLGIRDVEGLEFGRLTRYTLELTIGLAFEWDEVEPKVLATFEDILGGAGEIRRITIEFFEDDGDSDILFDDITESDGETEDIDAASEYDAAVPRIDYDYLEEERCCDDQAG